MTNLGSGVYQRALPDGSIELFSQTDGSGKIYMTEIIDPQGNAASIQYDANFRITAITDAIGQVSTLTYVSNTLGNSGFYKIAGITDPFGRTCSFTFDSTNTQLLTITDCIGLVSQMNHDTSSSFITALTTPYGTTSFHQYIPAATPVENATGLRFTYPDGTTSVIENWIGETRTTYLWNREATSLYPTDPANFVYTQC